MRIVKRADFSIQITLSVCALENKLSGFFHFWMTYNLSIFLNWKFCPNLLLYALQTPWITTLLDFEKYYSYIFHFFTSSNIAFEVTTFFSQTPISAAASFFSEKEEWTSGIRCVYAFHKPNGTYHIFYEVNLVMETVENVKTPKNRSEIQLIKPLIFSLQIRKTSGSIR